jgi:predicted nuclease of predicted toxin-antitoxin system
MKLLFDQNLSPKLVKSLGDVFPNSNHVFLLGLDESDDTKVWEYAKQNEFTLVTKDADFGDLSILRGFPPKVIWIRRGNCKTSEIESILRNNLTAIEQLENEQQIGLITLF